MDSQLEAVRQKIPGVEDKIVRIEQDLATAKQELATAKQTNDKEQERFLCDLLLSLNNQLGGLNNQLSGLQEEKNILLRSQAPRADVSNDIVSSLQAMAVKMDQVLSITSKGVTPQEESAQSLILTPGSRLSTTQAEKVFSRLHVEFTYSGLYGDIVDQQHVQTFHWPPEATEDSVAEVACQHLQSTYMPKDVVVIAVQSVVWMGHEWPEAKVKIKETSRTDYVMVYRGLAPEMVDLLIDKQRMCAELKIAVNKQAVQLQKLEDMHEESQFRSRQASKRRKGATDTSAISELVTLKEQLAESKQQLHDAYQDRIAALKDLLLHTVGHYEAKSEKAWTKVSSIARAQAALGWLVLNANQLESSSSHPGSIAIAGDFNKHFVYPPPPAAISTLHSLQTTLKVQAKRTLDTQPSRASTVAHVKMTLANLCNQLQANKAVIFEGAQTNSDSGTGGRRDGSEQGHEMANCCQKDEHGRASDAPSGSDRGGTGGSRGSSDHEAAKGNVLGLALTCQLRQPQIYQALGMDRPPISIPVFEADRWLESWHVIASSVPSQQAKLSRSPQSSILG